MAKSCEFKTSEASMKSYLRTQGAIDKFLKILDLNKFRTLVTKNTNLARIKLGVDEGRLFTEDGDKAVPNKKAFHTIDAKRNIYYPENLYIKEGTEPQESYDDSIGEVIVADSKPRVVLKKDYQEDIEFPMIGSVEDTEKNKINNTSELSSVGEQMSFDFEKLFTNFEDISPATREDIANAIKDGDLTIHCKL